MSDPQQDLVWRSSSDRAERVKELSLSVAEFAALTGANAGFSPAHMKQWMLFWKTDICEKDEFHTWFPRLSLAEAFSKYDYFLRVWPEWSSSGIWAPPYPGSRVAGGMVDYQYFPLPPELVERFKTWQAEYDESPPGGSVELDWKHFNETARGLTRDLKQCVGPQIYVEYDELVEVLMDGSTRSCRPLLGLPDGN